VEQIIGIKTAFRRAEDIGGRIDHQPQMLQKTEIKSQVKE
jgi:hypothetical protein